MSKKTISIATQIQAINLNSCLYNASGTWCTTDIELMGLAESRAGTYISKSCTLEHRDGNPSPRYFENKLGSINSMGLPNRGYEYYLDFAQKESEKYTKPFLMSVAGLTLESNLEMLKAIQKVDQVAAVELNLSCPNIAGKPQTGYDFERTQQVLESVFSFYDKPLGIKLPPYFDMVHFDMMAAILNQYPLAFVTCINSIGNGLVIDIESESVVIKPKGGFGGIGGDYVKPTALANVHRFYQLLRKDIAIIGCGGVKSGRDVFEHILAGATAVQIGTQLMKETPACFGRIEQELKDLMTTKNYHSITDFKGKLASI